RQAKNFGDLALNDSKGCGTIMRVAPVAFLATPEMVEETALETSALTHGHRTGQEAAAAWALILFAVLAGESVENAASAMIHRFGRETSEALRAALSAPRDGLPETVETLGGGWIAEEALSIALYAVLAARDLEEGLRIAVTHSGDSDSTGAIAGNLLGLLYPEQVMNHRWRAQIECPDVIDRLARDLVASSRGCAEELFDRYPGF
ncbi:MAG: ADP-ribosylglycohydrolase family protein, partial [Rhodobacteraceae bacterium]|nr:ADP-ribosylglycohydrolase family protein [Paracoccaceae bacterium]